MMNGYKNIIIRFTLIPKPNHRVMAKPSIFLFGFFAFLAPAAAVLAQPAQVSGKDAYLGETRPGTTPRIFAAGRISDGMSNRDMAISPSGDELFYTIQGAGGRVSVILYCHWTGAGWSGPQMAPFAGKYS